MLVPLLFLVASVAAAPVEDVSDHCVDCQLRLNVKYKGQPSEVIQSLFKEECAFLPRCQTVLTHCQIVERMMKTIHVEGAEAVNEKCTAEPHAQILADQPTPLMCIICHLTYNQFNKINNIVMNPNNKYAAAIQTLLGVTCNMFKNKSGTAPAYCGAILTAGMFQAVGRGISDSLGSVWDQVAVQGMGCPAYQDLFTICP